MYGATLPSVISSKSPDSLVQCASAPHPQPRALLSLTDPALSLCVALHRKGRFLFQYENYGSTAEDITEWLKK